MSRKRKSDDEGNDNDVRQGDEKREKSEEEVRVTRPKLQSREVGNSSRASVDVVQRSPAR